MSARPLAELGHAIAARLGELTGHQLGEGRLWRVETTLAPVMRAHGLPDLNPILAALHDQPSGPIAQSAIRALLNHETSFFRDLGVFRHVEADILPHLIRARRNQRTLRIWSAGCSTGQEVWSLAMLLDRRRKDLAGWRISIFATDLCAYSLAHAKAGEYDQMEVQRGLGIRDVMTCFTQTGDKWRIIDRLRSDVSFRVENLLEPSRLAGHHDLILCRNVLMYLTPDNRRRALQTLAEHTAPDGLLLLGAGETTIGTGSDFVPVRAMGTAYQLAANREHRLAG